MRVPTPLPPRTTPHWIVSEADAGCRLDKYLAQPDRAGSRSKAVAALARGKVFLNNAEAGTEDASRPLANGDDVRLGDAPPAPELTPPEVDSTPQPRR